MRVLFLRDFKRLNGGDLKMWHYFNHFLELGHDPVVQFSASSQLGPPNPWAGCDPSRLVPPDESVEADLLFLGGRDWERLEVEQRQQPPAPVLNLVQHVRHASKRQPELRSLLSHPAVRICVSPEVEEAIRRTGMPNGRVVTIPNGTDLRAQRTDEVERDIDILILAGKAKAASTPGLSLPRFSPQTIGRQIARLVDRGGRRVSLVTQMLPREEFIGLLSRARVSVLIPHAREGFYLPALEAMALGSIVVCPDCVGNRSFCRRGETAFVPLRNAVSMAIATDRALRLSEERRQQMRAAAWSQVDWHSLERERDALGRLLDDLGYGGPPD